MYTVGSIPERVWLFDVPQRCLVPERAARPCMPFVYCTVMGDDRVCVCVCESERVERQCFVFSALFANAPTGAWDGTNSNTS